MFNAEIVEVDVLENEREELENSRFSIRKSKFTILIAGHDDGWLSPDGTFLDIEHCHHVDVAFQIISNNNLLPEYEKVYLSRGLDTGEYLIHYLHYIALEGGHLLYKHFNKVQLDVMDLMEYNGIIVPKEKELIDEKEKNEKEYVMCMLDYYSQYKNQFHKKGQLRVGFKKWRELADKYNVKFE
jgi:hypothetical protein